MAYTNIDDPSAYFQTVLHSSAGSATITNDGNSDLQPDFIWSKARGQAYNHGLYDSTRGVTKLLSSNTDSDETTASSGFDLTSFNTDGFSTGNNQFNTICGGTTYVGWQWKANGGTTSSNTDGDITSTVQADTTAGFSIMTYTGTTGDVHTIGHGLGVTPDAWIVKARGDGGDFDDWFFWHHQMAASNVVDNRMMFLNTTAVPGTYTGINAVTSSTIRVKTSTTAQNTITYVAYAFAQKQGYSRFGKYIGNGSANGPFVYCGFKPAFVLIRRTDATNNWLIYDHKRSGYNPKQDKLYPDDASAEDASTTSVDLLSNGFKLRANSASQNAAGGSYIFMAFAANPFTTSTGIPTTAR
jgi:hypothetical protein